MLLIKEFQKKPLNLKLVYQLSINSIENLFFKFLTQYPKFHDFNYEFMYFSFKVTLNIFFSTEKMI